MRSQRCYSRGTAVCADQRGLVGLALAELSRSAAEPCSLRCVSRGRDEREAAVVLERERGMFSVVSAVASG